MSEKKAFHILVAEKLIEQLKTGTAPWQQPWKGVESFMPYNPVTKKRYKGINAIHLMMQNYRDTRWLTYRQAEEQGWQVRKKEHATSIQYWKLSELQDLLDKNGKPILDSNGKPMKAEVKLVRPRVFFASVFNASQIDGIPELKQEQITFDWNPIERAEKILKQSGAKIYHGDRRAFYRPSTDSIHLPHKEDFFSADGYYATALHELGHWTGHPSRLNRDLKHPFGSEGYAKEELRAEIFSLILGEELRIGHDPGQHTAYVQHWIKIIQDDAFEIFRAAADAEKIQDYVLGLEQQQQHENPLFIGENMMTETTPLPEQTDTKEKIYIQVPFAEKDEAKQLGAKWDRKSQSWYVPASIQDKAPFAKWMEAKADGMPETKEATNLNTRQYLAVPFRDRAIAKKAGALWDKEAKAWYAEPDADWSQLNRFLPKQNAPQQPSITPQEEFANELRSIGFLLENSHPIMDGQKHRVKTPGDKHGEASGFYIAYLDGHPAGYAINNRTKQETKWKSKGYYLNKEQKTTLQAQAKQKSIEKQTRRKFIEEETAKRCEAKIKQLLPILKPTPYLLAKQISVAPGIYTNRTGQSTCIPAYDEHEKIWSIQYVNKDGTKRFAKDSRKTGCFHVIGGMAALKKASAVIIAEGYATARSISEVLKMPVVVAFDSGNLPPTATALRTIMPDKPFIIAGDDDRHLEETHGVNPGRTKAQEAAKAVNGKCVFPKFTKKETTESSKAFTDFNDLAVKSVFGKNGIEHQIGVMLTNSPVIGKQEIRRQQIAR